MSTAELKYTLFKLIDAINDSDTLKDIYSFVAKKADADFWDSLSEDQKAEIETALKDLDAGLGIPNEKVMSQYKGKYL